jgi:RNA polymerase sigma-70 factor (ECF subfamily)
MPSSAPLPNPARDAFAARFTATRPALLRCAVRILRNAADAEDVVQEAALQAWRSLDSMRDQRHLATWLYRITFNAALDSLRRRNAAAATPLDDSIAASGSSPEHSLLSRLLAAEVRRSLRSLPPSYRSPVALRFSRDDLSYADIGERLGLSPNAAKLRVLRARRIIAFQLGEGCLPGSPA